jgi:hypothetical protein
MTKGSDSVAVSLFRRTLDGSEMVSRALRSLREAGEEGFGSAPLDRQVVGYAGDAIVAPFKLERAAAPERGLVQDRWILKGLPIDGEFPPVALGVLSENAVLRIEAHIEESADDKEVLAVVVQSLMRTAMAEFVLEGDCERCIPVRRYWWVSDHVEGDVWSLWNEMEWPLVWTRSNPYVRCGTALIEPMRSERSILARPDRYGPLGLEWSVQVKWERVGKKKWVFVAEEPEVEVYEENRHYCTRAYSYTRRFIVREMCGKPQYGA